MHKEYLSVIFSFVFSVEIAIFGLHFVSSFPHNIFSLLVMIGSDKLHFVLVWFEIRNISDKICVPKLLYHNLAFNQFKNQIFL